jgi:iron(III) transport system substrate-binding protein
MRRTASPLVAAVGVLCLAACSSPGGSPKTAPTTPSPSAPSPSSPSSSALSSPSSSAPSPSSLDSLIAASHTEKGLVIYGNPPSQLWKPVIAAFNKQYPWIAVSANDVDDTVVFSKYAAEHGTGARTADILVASAPNLWGGAVKNGILQDFTPPGLADFPSFTRQGGGLFVLSPDPAITIYNKQLLKANQVPATVTQMGQDAAAGKYKISTYTIDNTFGYSAFWGYVQKNSWASLDHLGPKTKIAADGGTMLQNVAQGGVAIGLFESGLVRGALAGFKDLVGWEYTTDFTPLIPRGIGVTAGASSPNSAKLFVDFLFSSPGQQSMCDSGFTASMVTFSPTDACQNSLKAVYDAVGEQHTFLVPLSGPVASDQPSFTARWRQAFKG